MDHTGRQEKGVWHADMWEEEGAGDRQAGGPEGPLTQGPMGP